MEKSYEIEVVERLARIETLLLDVPDLKLRVRRLEIGLVGMFCALGGFEIVSKVIAL